ncbi:MAG TPA: hypothetical protein VGM94_08230 [Galbitalea sp.]|jgi:hypothetical protein
MNSVPTTTATIESRGTTALRTTTILVTAYAALSVVTLVAVILLRNNPDIVNVAVWIRGCFAAASGITLTLFAIVAARGSRPAYRRVRIISAVIVVAIAAIILLPGTFPLWMKIEQGACELLLIGVVILVNRRHVRAEFAPQKA